MCVQLPPNKYVTTMFNFRQIYKDMDMRKLFTHLKITFLRLIVCALIIHDSTYQMHILTNQSKRFCHCCKLSIQTLRRAFGLESCHTDSLRGGPVWPDISTDKIGLRIGMWFVWITVIVAIRIQSHQLEMKLDETE